MEEFDLNILIIIDHKLNKVFANQLKYMFFEDQFVKIEIVEVES